jgi:hypothetical protein
MLAQGVTAWQTRITTKSSSEFRANLDSKMIARPLTDNPIAS